MKKPNKSAGKDWTYTGQVKFTRHEEMKYNSNTYNIQENVIRVHLANQISIKSSTEFMTGTVYFTFSDQSCSSG